MLTAPGERRVVGNGEVETHYPEQRVQEPFGLAQREMVDEPQGQSGLDGEIRVAPLPTPPAAPAGRPGSDRFRGHPHRHIAAANEGPVVGRPVRDAIFRLVRGMDLRLHPCRVAPAEGHEKCRPNRLTPAEGLSCNNAPSVVHVTDSVREQSSRGLPPTDASAGAPDAAFHVGRSAPTVRVGSRDRAASLPRQSTPPAVGSPPPAPHPCVR